MMGLPEKSGELFVPVRLFNLASTYKGNDSGFVTEVIAEFLQQSVTLNTMSLHLSVSTIVPEYSICLKPELTPPLHVDGAEEQFGLITISDPVTFCSKKGRVNTQLFDLTVAFMLTGGRLPEQSL
ncbi:MAG: hypothetical protein ACO1G6_14135 [Bacteroidota bacterium]